MEMELFNNNFDSIDDELKQKEIEAARALIWMSRGTDLQLEFRLLSPPKEYRIFRAFGEMIDIHELHTFELDNEYNQQNADINDMFCYMLEASDFQRFAFIYQVMNTNPLALDYNPNKSNAITSYFSDYDYDMNQLERRRKNNVASRLSRHRKKTQYRLSQVNTEYLEEINERLTNEINSMSDDIRQQQIKLQQIHKSSKIIVKLQKECGLKAIPFN